jgi:hypothetical protein
VDDSKCKAAQDWWAKNNQYWSDVRKVWDEVYASKETLTFKSKVEDKVLFERIFALGDDVNNSETYSSQEIQKQVLAIIQQYQK